MVRRRDSIFEMAVVPKAMGLRVALADRAALAAGLVASGLPMAVVLVAPVVLAAAGRGVVLVEIAPKRRQVRASAVKTETRKLGSYEAFVAATLAPKAETNQPEMRGGHGSMNLKTFAETRRQYLMKQEVK